MMDLSFLYQLLNLCSELGFLVQVDGQVQYANQKTMELLKYSDDSLRPTSILQIDQDYTFSSWQECCALLQKRKYLELKRVWLTSDQSRKTVLLKASYLTHPSNPMIVLLGREITQAESDSLPTSKTRTQGEKMLDAADLESVAASPAFSSLISRHPPFIQSLHQLEKAAQTDISILLEGETGTGKELLAESVHQISSRNSFPLVKVNCATLTDTLIESELFGYEKGAFTSAESAKPGRFELAHRGSIFLDEIGELPPALQPKLLRVLQDGCFERVGGVRTISVDVRVIAATNQELEDLVDQGRFRMDLFFRLNAFPFRTVPLRERKNDIPLLAKFFLKQFSQQFDKPMPDFTAEQLNRLSSLSFPGNIRQLKNIIQRAVILSDERALDLDSVWKSKHKTSQNGNFLTFQEIQRQHILSALEKTDWKVSGPTGAANLLAMNSNTLVTTMKRLGITRPSRSKAQKARTP